MFGRRRHKLTNAEVKELEAVRAREAENSERMEALKAENEELKTKNEMLEECLIEMGNIIYA